MELTPELLYEKRKSKGLTQQEVADYIGVSQAIYGMYEMGKRNPKRDKVDRLIQILQLENITNDIKSAKLIPVYDVEINAGIVELIKDAIKENIVGYLDLPEAQGADIIITVRGDSMATLYNNGDRIAIKLVHDKAQIFYGKPYVVITSELSVLKYIRKHINPDIVILRSENRELYDDFDIEKKAIIYLFKVLCVIKAV